MKLSFNDIKENCSKIHYFGLGFIQVKLRGNERLHFYTKELPAIVDEEEIHNHRRNFNSTILFGTLSQMIFDVVPGSHYTLERESCKEGIETQSEPKLVDVHVNSRHDYSAGSNYWIGHETFHRVTPAGEAITHLQLSEPIKDHAEVVRQVGSEKVCPFSQKVDESKLWEIVERMIREANTKTYVWRV